MDREIWEVIKVVEEGKLSAINGHKKIMGIVNLSNTDSFATYLNKVIKLRNEFGYSYTDYDIELNKKYIMYCWKIDLSPYKCLEFMCYQENIKDEYKKETGDYVHFRETETGKKLYYEDYVKWLENKIVKLYDKNQTFSDFKNKCPKCDSLIIFSDIKQNGKKMCFKCGHEFYG